MGDQRYDPWSDLRHRSHIHLDWTWLPHGMGGVIYDQGDRRIIALCFSLRTRAQRRTLLAHELVHDERGLIPPDAPVPLIEKEEAYVRRVTAQRLAPPADIAAWAAAQCEPITAQDIATEWDVTMDVALEAARHTH